MTEEEIRAGTEPAAADETPSGTEETPSPEQQLETLRTELETKSSELEKANRSMEGLRGSLKDWEKKAKEQANIQGEVDVLKNMVKVLATQGYQMSDDEFEESARSPKQDINKMFADLEEKSKKERQEAETRRRQEELFAQADAIHDRAVAVFADDVDSISRVRGMLRSGDTDLAEKMVAGAEGKKKPEGDNVGSDEEKRKKWIEEGKRLAMEESLKTDTGGPQGGTGRTFTRSQIAAMSPSEYVENREAIQKAYSEERIKDE